MINKVLIANHKSATERYEKVKVEFANCDACIFSNDPLATEIDCKLGASNMIDYVEVGCSEDNGDSYNFIKKPLGKILKEL